MDGDRIAIFRVLNEGNLETHTPSLIAPIGTDGYLVFILGTISRQTSTNMGELLYLILVRVATTVSPLC